MGGKAKHSARARRATALPAVVGVVALAACGGGSTPKEKVTATEREYSISLDRSTVPAGKFRLAVQNTGAAVHELVAFRSDLPDGGLPVKGDQVDENGVGITHIEPEAEDIDPGKTKQVTLNLTAGRYVLICNIATHYAQGMHAVLTVS